MRHLFFDLGGRLLPSAAGQVEVVLDLLGDGMRRDAVLLVVLLLQGAAALRFGDGALDGFRHRIGIQDDPALCIAGGAADRLNERGLVAQEAFLVGVQDGDKCNLRNVQPLAQQVDADQHIEFPKA